MSGLSVKGNKKLLLLFSLFIFFLVIKHISCVYLLNYSRCAAPPEATTEKGEPFSTRYSAYAMANFDTETYFQPFENKIQQKGFYMDYYGVKTSAARVYLYGSFYYFFRHFFDVENSWNAMYFFQLIVEAFSLVLLCLLAHKLFKSRLAFILAVVLCILNVKTTAYTYQLGTESLSTSFLICFLYFYYHFRAEGKNNNLFASGIFLGLDILLRPYHGVFFLVVAADLLLVNFAFSKQHFLKFSREVIIVAIPFIVLLAPWSIWNSLRLNRAVLFTSTLYLGESEIPNANEPVIKSHLKLYSWLSAWGGTYQWWEPYQAASYFKKDALTYYQIPDHALSKSYSREDIEKMRKLYFELQDEFSRENDSVVSVTLEHFTRAYKSERPFDYYVMSPLRITGEFIFFHSGVTEFVPHNLKSHCSDRIFLPLKIIQAGIYWLFIITGFAGLFLLFFKRHIISVILCGFPLILILILCFILRNAQYRYFIAAYPFLFIGTCYIATITFNKLKTFRPQRQ